MRMADRGTVCRTLRQLTPDREWRYLGEAELYLLSCMVNDLRKDLVEENQHLRKELREMDAVRAENERLRELVNSYADLFEKEAATNNGHGPHFSGEDWLALANDMRVELAISVVASLDEVD